MYTVLQCLLSKTVNTTNSLQNQQILLELCGHYPTSTPKMRLQERHIQCIMIHVQGKYVLFCMILFVTLVPFSCSSATLFLLCDGSTSAKTQLWLMPTSRAMACAVRRLSPVRSRTCRPMRWRVNTVSAASDFTVSAMAIWPTRMPRGAKEQFPVHAHVHVLNFATIICFVKCAWFEYKDSYSVTLSDNTCIPAITNHNTSLELKLPGAVSLA